MAIVVGWNDGMAISSLADTLKADIDKTDD